MPSLRLQMKVRNDGAFVMSKSRPNVTIQIFRELELTQRTLDETKEDIERVRRSIALDAEHIATSQRQIAESWAFLAKASRLTDQRQAPRNPAQRILVDPIDPVRDESS